MSAHDTPLTVLGAGAWGTALAARAAHAGTPVRLWGRDAGTIAAINHQRRNPTYLPDVQLPEGITGYASASEALAGVHDVLLAGPTSAFNELLAFVAEHVTHPRVVWACKGLERETGRFLSDVVAERLGAQVPCAIISCQRSMASAVLALIVSPLLRWYEISNRFCHAFECLPGL